MPPVTVAFGRYPYNLVIINVRERSEKSPSFKWMAFPADELPFLPELESTDIYTTETAALEGGTHFFNNYDLTPVAPSKYVF